MSNLNKAQIDHVIILYNEGKFQEALDALIMLNNEYPNVPMIFNLLGVCYKSLGKINNALEAFEVASKIKPDYSEAYFNQGVIHQELNSLEKAIYSYKKTIEIMPKNPKAYNNLGIIYRNLGQIENAVENFEWAVAYKRDFAEAHNNLGICFQDIDQLDKAIECYLNAVKFMPDYAQAFNNLGIAYNELGQVDNAIKSYEQAIKIEPNFASAYYNLVDLKKYKSNDSQILQITDLLKSKDLDQNNRVMLNFALAKIYENLGLKDQMFKFLDEGNILRKQELNFSFEITNQANQSIKDLFNTKNSDFSINEKNKYSLKPIFIVGMPRSGSTLIEQIISSHNEVSGLGEIEYFSKIVAKSSQEIPFLDNNILTEESIVSIRNKYLESSKIKNIKEKYFTDKWPLNFRNIGFILSAFPDAKIINTQRNSIATCWSIYKYYFSSNGNGWAYSQEDISNFYKLYEDLMKYWHEIYPNKIYDISYEKLTDNQEDETRKLLDYCGLEWDENCMNFHNNKRAVKTASSLQVRKKMYQGSSEAWKDYEDYLQPLIQSLKPS